MGRFTNDETGVLVSVDDSKDYRFPAGGGWTAATGEGADAPQAPDVATVADEAGDDAEPASDAVTSDPGAAGVPDDTWKVADLERYATDNAIDLGGATRKADILDAIAGRAGDES